MALTERNWPPGSWDNTGAALSGQEVLVYPTFTQRKGQRKEIYQFEEAGLRGLRRGLGQRLVVEAVVFPELRPEVYQNPGSSYIDPKTTTPLSYLMAEGALDAVWRQHLGAELFVSLIGLPLNVKQTGPGGTPRSKFACCCRICAWSAIRKPSAMLSRPARSPPSF